MITGTSERKRGGSVARLFRTKKNRLKVLVLLNV
jgi:hypothetical protein